MQSSPGEGLPGTYEYSVAGAAASADARGAQGMLPGSGAAGAVLAAEGTQSASMADIFVH
ncbi:hypothetical protein [uncultured Arthrobacter sp.]|uniref:hypothetical protein n=1 Tax=uncultured Arthrobacter sp. TaxID=114050 RepID=UPI00321736CD